MTLPVLLVACGGGGGGPAAVNPDPPVSDPVAPDPGDVGGMSPAVSVDNGVARTDPNDPSSGYAIDPAALLGYYAGNLAGDGVGDSGETYVVQGQDGVVDSDNGGGYAVIVGGVGSQSQSLVTYGLDVTTGLVSVSGITTLSKVSAGEIMVTVSSVATEVNVGGMGITVGSGISITAAADGYSFHTYETDSPPYYQWVAGEYAAIGFNWDFSTPHFFHTGVPTTPGNDAPAALTYNLPHAFGYHKDGSAENFLVGDGLLEADFIDDSIYMVLDLYDAYGGSGSGINLFASIEAVSVRFDRDNNLFSVDNSSTFQFSNLFSNRTFTGADVVDVSGSFYGSGGNFSEVAGLLACTACGWTDTAEWYVNFIGRLPAAPVLGDSFAAATNAERDAALAVFQWSTDPDAEGRLQVAVSDSLLRETYTPIAADNDGFASNNGGKGFLAYFYPDISYSQSYFTWQGDIGTAMTFNWFRASEEGPTLHFRQLAAFDSSHRVAADHTVVMTVGSGADIATMTITYDQGTDTADSNNRAIVRFDGRNGAAGNPLLALTVASGYSLVLFADTNNTGLRDSSGDQTARFGQFIHGDYVGLGLHYHDSNRWWSNYLPHVDETWGNPFFDGDVAAYFGTPTHPDAVPSAGTATYNLAHILGAYYEDDGSDGESVRGVRLLSGFGTLDADFATGQLGLNFTVGDSETGDDFLTVSNVGLVIADGQSRFHNHNTSGGVVNYAGSGFRDGTGQAGYIFIDGGFYGPNAEEVAGGFADWDPLGNGVSDDYLFLTFIGRLLADPVLADSFAAATDAERAAALAVFEWAVDSYDGRAYVGASHRLLRETYTPATADNDGFASDNGGKGFLAYFNNNETRWDWYSGNEGYGRSYLTWSGDIGTAMTLSRFRAFDDGPTLQFLQLAAFDSSHRVAADHTVVMTIGSGAHIATMTIIYDQGADTADASNRPVISFDGRNDGGGNLLALTVASGYSLVLFADTDNADLRDSDGNQTARFGQFVHGDYVALGLHYHDSNRWWSNYWWENETWGNPFLSFRVASYFGTPTHPDAVPSAGTATYNLAHVLGAYFADYGRNGDSVGGVRLLGGSGSLDADFATGQLALGFTVGDSETGGDFLTVSNLRLDISDISSAGNRFYSDVGLDGAAASAVNYTDSTFTDKTGISTDGNGGYHVYAAGGFYGPNAEEVGGRFVDYDPLGDGLYGDDRLNLTFIGKQ